VIYVLTNAWWLLGRARTDVAGGKARDQFVARGAVEAKDTEGWTGLAFGEERRAWGDV
jgi:hypothetical protein